MIDNDWGISRFPLVPGHEIIGDVVACGEQVRHISPGARVGIGWQRSADMTCNDCLHGNDNLCEHAAGMITHGYGGFADHVVADSRFCFPIPSGIAAESAGPLLCGGVTVYAALRNAGLAPGMRVGVIGIGGLGHMAVQFAAKLGSEVTIFTTSPDKADEAARLGARNAVITTKGERVRSKERFDILLNTVPVHTDWNAYLKLLKANGTLSFVGVPPGPAEIDIGLLLAKQRRITASVIGSRALITDMLEAADRFGISPQVEMFKLADVNQALQTVRDNTVRYRAVLEVAG
jgi:alcohol/geraniol dehydrogenase (NADP+)